MKKRNLDIVQVNGKIPLRILNVPVEEIKEKKEVKKTTKKKNK